MTYNRLLRRHQLLTVLLNGYCPWSAGPRLHKATVWKARERREEGKLSCYAALCRDLSSKWYSYHGEEKSKHVMF